MNITAIGSSTSTLTSYTKDNNQVDILEKQKMKLQEQLKNLNDSKLEESIKRERRKDIESQIEQLDAEIQSIQNEKVKDNLNSNKEHQNKSASTSKNDPSEINNQNELFQLNSTYSKAKIINKTKNDFNGKERVLKMEIKLDAGRGAATERKEAELKEIDKKDKKLDKKLSEVHKEVKNKDKNMNASAEINEEVAKEEDINYRKIDVIV
ncbi:FlxA-like family protein [Clostridium sp. 'White wine YQ']|uniref:FlxA-like family protein n=1 Tax=Clostridium sp. 'White wine YQ' TaxID=3027474 RepID=UPI0023673386|nr:FlxA-like family protein [Clostridium sp. 'White wine YQ']MDD7794481.1 FlxA-like family protein [Clostridium sp. 'White wine YQ']